MEEKLIIAVCARPELYDTKLVMYRDRAVRKKTWCSVSEEVGLPRKSFAYFEVFAYNVAYVLAFANILYCFSGSVQEKVEESPGPLYEGKEEGVAKKEQARRGSMQKMEILCCPVLPGPVLLPTRDERKHGRKFRGQYGGIRSSGRSSNSVIRCTEESFLLELLKEKHY